nr:hypothetical protein [Tanacetum cinerariifolium]
MVDPEFDEEVMDDDDDWEDDLEWLMVPVTPPRATMAVSSTYEVAGPSTAAVKGLSAPLPAHGLPVPPTAIEDLSTRLGNLEYRHGVLMRKVEEVSDAEVADSIFIGEIHPKEATVEEQVQVMESQAVQVVSRLKEIETRVQQVESRVDTYPSDDQYPSKEDDWFELSIDDGKVKVFRVFEMIEHDGKACIYGPFVRVDTNDILTNNEFPVLNVGRKIITEDNG